MSNRSSSINVSNTSIQIMDSELKHFYLIQFWIFLTLIIPALIFLLFGLYHFLMDRNLRQSLHNHAIIVVLIANFLYLSTDMIWFIHYFHSFNEFSPGVSFRLIWGYIDWAIFALQYILYAWITIERHILIFYQQLFAIGKNRLFFHYIPPTVLTIYCLIYYAIVLFATTCNNDFNNLLAPNYMPCAFANNSLKMYEVIIHAIIPTFIIVFSSVILLIRIFWKKYRVRHQFRWRRYRIMATQSLLISCIFLIFPFPYMLVISLQLCGLSASIGGAFLSIARFSSYYALLLFPIVAVASSTEIQQKFTNLIRCYRLERIVAPAGVLRRTTVP